MAYSKTKATIVIVLTLVVYIINLVLSRLAGKGSSDLFPRSVGDASRIYPLEVTPAGATFSIWVIIKTYQMLWIIYAMSTIFRQGDQTEILSTKFYVSFIMNIILVTTWLFVWTRLEVVASSIVLTISQIFLVLAIGISLTDLTDYEETHKMNPDNKIDIWCQRILVQNGLLFYGTWATLATLINTAVVLTYELDVSNETSSLIALSFLGILSVVWFILENFVLQRYTSYTVTAYIVLIYALSGIFARAWGKYEAVGGLVLALLILSIIFLVVRIVLLVFKSYDSIGYKASKSTVLTANENC